MTTCSNGPSLWKPFTKASQLFTQKREKAEAKDRDRLERKEKEGLEINGQKLSAKEKDDGR